MYIFVITQMGIKWGLFVIINIVKVIGEYFLFFTYSERDV